MNNNGVWLVNDNTYQWCDNKDRKKVDCTGWENGRIHTEEPVYFNEGLLYCKNCGKRLFGVEAPDEKMIFREAQAYISGYYDHKKQIENETTNMVKVENEIKIGSIVRLKSGSPRLTISQINYTTYKVQWFNGVGFCSECMAKDCFIVMDDEVESK